MTVLCCNSSLRKSFSSSFQMQVVKFSSNIHSSTLSTKAIILNMETAIPLYQAGCPKSLASSHSSLQDPPYSLLLTPRDSSPQLFPFPLPTHFPRELIHPLALLLLYLHSDMVCIFHVSTPCMLMCATNLLSTASHNFKG